MSLVLVDNPVITEGGIVKNLFAGFLPVEFKFKREDLGITNVAQGPNNTVIVTTNIDLSSELSVGDSAYLFSEGSTYVYDESGEVLTVTATTITINAQFVENTTSGYINYKQNYFVEAELVSVSNTDVRILPFSLKDDGDNAGNATIDVSIANDKNELEFEYVLDQLEDARLKFKVQYREVWEGSSESFTLIDDEVILYFATDQPEIEQFLQELDEAFVYEGYPFGAILLHSDQNSDAGSIVIKYDELDINQSVIVADNSIGVVPSDDYGQIFANLDKDTSYDVDTEHVRFKAELTDVAFFDPAFFDPAFFETT